MKKQVLLVLLSFLVALQSTWAQNQTITGRVTSAAEGTALPGVNVLIKGTNTGTTTGADGSYSITASPEATLVFTFIGFNSQEILVGNRSTINVALAENVSQLGEVVVTAVGITREKKSLGYATTQLSNDDLLQGQNTNPINALQGKVAGLNINAGGNGPGSSSRIVLRGPTSFTGNNQPLFVIDGMIVSNSNFRSTNSAGTEETLDNQVDYGNRGNDLNPQDIESVSVLRGPAAAALYGSAASNGAIIITTKRGQSGTMAITLNSNVQFSDILKLPDFQNQFGQGDVDNVKDDRRENFSWGLPFDGQERPYGQVINNQQKLKRYEALPNNVRDFFNLGKTYNNTLSIGGGNDKNTYYLSLGSQNSSGVVPTTEYNKYSIRLNASSEFSEKFSSSVSFNYINVNSTPANGGQGDAFYQQIIGTPRDISIVDLKDLSDPFNSVFTGPDGTQYYGYYGAYTKNPYFLLENNRNNNKVDRVTGNFALTYKPIEGLDITERIGGDVFSDRRYQRFAKYEYVPIDPLYVDNDWVAVGRYSEDIINYSFINHDLIATYTRNLTPDVNLRVLAGNNIRKTVSNRTFAQTNPSTGLVVAGLYTLSNSDGPIDAASTIQENFLMGFYGEVGVSYKDLLFLNVTGRNDWSSTLPRANRSFFYPSVSGSFVFSQLLGEGIQNVLSFGKLRSSWARVGNDAPPYRLTSVYVSRSSQDITGDFGSTRFPLNNVPAFTQGDRIGNNALTPEFTTSFEIGTELGFLNNRLNLDATYFNTRSTDQIVNVPVSPSSGFQTRTMNAGEMKNEGIELAVRATPLQTPSGFKLDVYGTFTKVKNSVVSISEGVEQISVNPGGAGLANMYVVATVGKPYGTFYGAGALRDPATGRVVIDPLTGLPITDPTNRYFGSYLPDYQASLGATLSYKGFTLNALFDTKQGGYFYSNTREDQAFVGTSPETVQNNRQDYVFPNSVYQAPDGSYVPNTEITFHPYTYYTNIIGQNKIPEFNLVSASYVKFREASLNYTFPSRLFEKTPLSGVTVGVFGNNLFIWTPKENTYADPEINSQGASNVQGFEFSATPSLRNYGFNVRLTL